MIPGLSAVTMQPSLQGVSCSEAAESLGKSAAAQCMRKMPVFS